jgi:hypothetical protein
MEREAKEAEELERKRKEAVRLFLVCVSMSSERVTPGCSCLKQRR